MELLSIKQELNKRHRKRSELEVYYLNKRLEKTLDVYYKELEESLGYLERRQPENVIKKL